MVAENKKVKLNLKIGLSKMSKEEKDRQRQVLFTEKKGVRNRIILKKK